MHKSKDSLFSFRIHVFHLHKNIPEGGEAEMGCLPEGFSLGKHPFWRLGIHRVGFLSSLCPGSAELPHEISSLALMGALGLPLYWYIFSGSEIVPVSQQTCHEHHKVKKSLEVPWGPEIGIQIVFQPLSPFDPLLR